MFKMTKRLTKLIEQFPEQKIFCENVGVDQSTLSNVLADRKPIPQSLMISIQDYLKWPFDDLFEAKD